MITANNFFSLYIYTVTTLVHLKAMGWNMSQTDKEKTGKDSIKEKSLRLISQEVFPLHSGNQTKK